VVVVVLMEHLAQVEQGVVEQGGLAAVLLVRRLELQTREVAVAEVVVVVQVLVVPQAVQVSS